MEFDEKKLDSCLALLKKREKFKDECLYLVEWREGSFERKKLSVAPMAALKKGPFHCVDFASGPMKSQGIYPNTPTLYFEHALGDNTLDPSTIQTTRQLSKPWSNAPSWPVIQRCPCSECYTKRDEGNAILLKKKD